MPSTPELKATLTLPQTAFSMKANLPQNEPLRLKKWAEMKLYEQIRKARATSPGFLLHDGPPYANGAIHLGHALNKGLKDFVVKSKTMAGYDAPYIPGFDCHGLPIEIKVDEKLGRKKLEMPVPSVLNACREYAQKYVDMQSGQFERIGILGRWDKPYRTLDRAYEAKILEAFYGFLEKGYVYRGLKPVYWCTHDRTALAEAEVEYANHTSSTIYVRYKLTSDATAIDPALAAAIGDRDLYTIIWTTTPWTMPASMAVAFHPEFEYIAVAPTLNDTCCPSNDVYIIAASLADQVAKACNWASYKELGRVKGSQLERSTFKHPFLERSILGVLADYVTADTGTGVVHTAPSHGADDFYTGVRYGIDTTCRVDAGGHIHVDEEAWPFTQPPAFEGKSVWEANPIIIALLEERGALLGSGPIEHSYPHCWRCHHPVIFRATEQWFIKLDTPAEGTQDEKKTYRQVAIDEIDKVNWDPSWGKERITNMIATRPDWCISRQRIWGVPIAVFMCEQCNEPILDTELNRKVVDLFEREGIESWHSPKADALLPAGTKCSHCGGTTFRKEKDILDVWFDSGVSWLAVCESDPDLKKVYDGFIAKDGTKVLYLEGGDQHRGWFHSSLLTSVALRGRAPYTNVATAGWTLDEQGRAMSKSLGNGVDPVDIAKRLGGEIVRLWVASVDFREDMAASENLMQRCAEIYRKLRNTFRYLLGSLSGFNPAKDAVAFDQLEPLDRYMLARTRKLTEEILGWYDSYEFHKIYHAVNEFAIADLSAFYLDVLKDRLYTFAPTSRERRSAQTVLWQIAEALTRLVAPILSFTADEIWEKLPEVEGREASVHLAHFPKPEALYPEDPTTLIDEWKKLFALRDAAMLKLEEARKDKRIGKGLEAEVELAASGEQLALLRKYAGSLKEILNVSAVRVLEGAELKATVLPASGHKCARCWNFVPTVSNYGAWAAVCPRCQSALEEMGIARPEAAE